MALRFRRGTNSERTNGFIPAIGEPIYTTDTKALYVGDGSTVGGVQVGANVELQDIGDVSLPTSTPVPVSLVFIDSEVVTITTAGIHQFLTGDAVQISLNDQSQVNGNFTITVVSSTSFTYPLPNADDLSERIVTGTATKQIRDQSILAYDIISERWIDQSFVYSLSSLGDVQITNLTDDHILRYDSTAQKWINEAISISIDDLTDVSLLGTPADGEILTYDSNTSTWINKAYTFSIDDLSDVDTSSAVTGDLLVYNGDDWISQALSISSLNIDDLSDVSISGPLDGQLLRYDETNGEWVNTTFTTSIENFSDVTFTDLQNGDIISYDGNGFVNKTFTLDDLGDVEGTTGSVTDRAVLAYSSASSTWTAQQIQSLSSRQDVVISTGTIADGAVVDVDFTAFTGYAILRAQASAVSILTLYAAEEDRTADASRDPSLIVPPINKGIFAELKFLDTAVNKLGPVLMGYNDDAIITRAGYARVKNTSGSSQADITITLTVIQVEDDPIT